MEDPAALGSSQALTAGEEELSPQELLELIRTQHEGAARSDADLEEHAAGYYTRGSWALSGH